MVEVDFFVYVLYVWLVTQTARNGLGDLHILRLQSTNYKLPPYNLDEMVNEVLHVVVVISV